MRSFTSSNMAQVTDLNGMFQGCSALKTIYTEANTNWNDEEQLPDLGSEHSNMFTGCPELEGFSKYRGNRVNATGANTVDGYFTVKVETADEFQNLNYGGLYIMMEDIDLGSGTLTGRTTSSSDYSETIILDLNGHVLSNDGFASLIRQQNEEVTLEIRDSGAVNSDGNTFDWTEWDGMAALPERYGVLSGGSIEVINWASLTLKGGAIERGDATRDGRGGGVYVNYNSAFAMEGGRIASKQAQTAGGGVYNRGTFELSGGVIEENNAPQGGGVYNEAGAAFRMSGGLIRGNGGTDSSGFPQGGGVYNLGDFTLSDSGRISENSATEGGGVYNAIDRRTTGRFTMTGGAISANEASETGGGGIYNDGSLTLRGGVIGSIDVPSDGNRAPDGSGGGVYSSAGSSFTLSGGRVVYNTSKLRGGGVLTMTRVMLSGSPRVHGNTCAMINSDRDASDHDYGDNFVFQYDDSTTEDEAKFEITAPMSASAYTGGVNTKIHVSVLTRSSTDASIYIPQEGGFIFTEGFKTHNPEVNPNRIFWADAPAGKNLMVGSSDPGGEAILQNHVHANLTYLPDADTATLTIRCSEAQGNCFLGRLPESDWDEEMPAHERSWKLVPSIDPLDSDGSSLSFTRTDNAAISFSAVGPFDENGDRMSVGDTNANIEILYWNVTVDSSGARILGTSSTEAPTAHGDYAVSMTIRDQAGFSEADQAAVEPLVLYYRRTGTAGHERREVGL